VTRTLLLDADSLVYSLSYAHQMPMPWTDELWTYKGDLKGAQLAFQEFLERTMEATECDAAMVALSDTRDNFRKRVRGSYKRNRISKDKPVLFKALRDYLKAEHGARMHPGLEGDDLVSIWATNKAIGEGVVCSIDKDCRGIPCELYNPNRQTSETISEAEAEHFFLMQVLTGDRTDGYEGCPGIGPKRAASLLKGVPLEDVWQQVIVPTYRAAGLSEAAALENARCARLLRCGELSPNQIRLWTPNGGGEWVDNVAGR